MNEIERNLIALYGDRWNRLSDKVKKRTIKQYQSDHFAKAQLADQINQQMAQKEANMNLPTIPTQDFQLQVPQKQYTPVIEVGELKKEYTEPPTVRPFNKTDKEANKESSSTKVTGAAIIESGDKKQKSKKEDKKLNLPSVDALADLTAQIIQQRTQSPQPGSFGGSVKGTGGGGASGGWEERESKPKEEKPKKKKTLIASVQKSKTRTFNEAFAEARKKGLKQFEFNGGIYGTELGNNPNWKQAGDSRTETITGPEQIIILPMNKNGNKLISRPRYVAKALYGMDVALLKQKVDNENNAFQSLMQKYNPQAGTRQSVLQHANELIDKDARNLYTNVGGFVGNVVNPEIASKLNRDNAALANDDALYSQNVSDKYIKEAAADFNNDDAIPVESLGVYQDQTIQRQARQAARLLKDQQAKQSQARLNSYAQTAKAAGLRSPDEVKAFQEAMVIGEKKDLGSFGSNGIDGVFGPRTQALWNTMTEGGTWGDLFLNGKLPHLQKKQDQASDEVNNSTVPSNYSNLYNNILSIYQNEINPGLRVNSGTYDLGNGYSLERTKLGRDYVTNSKGQRIYVDEKDGKIFAYGANSSKYDRSSDYNKWRFE